MPTSTKLHDFALVAAAAAALVLGAARPARADAVADLGQGLVGYWRLDEPAIADGAVASDASGGKHDGVYVNGGQSSPRVPALRYGDPRSAAFTRAAHQAVRVAAMPPALEPAAVTISAWVLATSTDVDRTELVSAGDSYILYLTAAGLGAGRRQASGWSDVLAPLPSPGLLDGQWHHVAATIDGGALEVFADGASAGRSAQAGAIVYDLGPDLWLGRFGNGTMARDFEGNLDEVAIFDRVLAPDEIAALARGDQPGVTTASADAGAGGAGGSSADASAENDAGAPPLAPDDAGLPPLADASAAPPAAPPPSPAPPSGAGGAAGSDAATVRRQFQDSPTTCAAGGSPGGGALGVVSLVALLALTGTRRRARTPRR